MPSKLPPELQPEVETMVQIIQEMEKHHLLSHFFKLSFETRKSVCVQFLKSLEHLTHSIQMEPKLIHSPYFKAIQAYWLGEYSPQPPVREALTKIIICLMKLPKAQHAMQIDHFCGKVDHFLFEKAEASLLNKAVKSLMKLSDIKKMGVLNEFRRSVFNAVVYSKKKNLEVNAVHIQKLQMLLKKQHPDLNPQVLHTLTDVMIHLLKLPWNEQLKLIVAFQKMTERVVVKTNKTYQEARKKKDAESLQEKLKTLQAHAVEKASGKDARARDGSKLTEAEVKLQKKSTACRNIPLDVYFDQHLIINPFIMEILVEAVDFLKKQNFYYLDELEALNNLFKKQVAGNELKYFNLETKEAEIVNELHNRYGANYRGVMAALDRLSGHNPQVFSREDSKIGLAILGMRLVIMKENESHHSVHIKPL